MIQLKQLNWSNWFSYGENNTLKFMHPNSPLVQIVGENGSGKSSIPLILQELCYGKNSKGIKKANITNRYAKNNTARAELHFSKDKNDYVLILERGKTAKLSLFENGIDISSHTTTNTYKTVEQILERDFKLFVQLTYQSSKDSLQFLTDTDLGRKKFLINFFNLEKYINYYDQFKAIYTENNLNIRLLTGKIQYILTNIADIEKMDLVKQNKILIPSYEINKEIELNKLKEQLLNITVLNEQIKKDNTKIDYKENFKLLDEPKAPFSDDDYLEYERQLTSISTAHLERLAAINAAKKRINEIKAVPSICPSCKQSINRTQHQRHLLELNDDITSYENQNKNSNEIMKGLKEKITAYKQYSKVFAEYINNKKEYESIDISNLEKKELLDSNILEEKINSLQKQINIEQKYIKELEEKNAQIIAKNALIDSKVQELDKCKSDLFLFKSELKEATNYNSLIDTLMTIFSPKGFVAYKIKYLVKDLQTLINKYLEVISDGRFAIRFTLKEDKLLLNIIDFNRTIEIEELSSGELARVNLATILAIRKLMSQFSSTKINVLFLDEITGVLDNYGKEKLMEILLEEKDLNTFIVAHDWSHPLVPTIHITKTKNISSLSQIDD